MKYSTDLTIEKSKMDFLLSLLKHGGSIEEVNKTHGTNYKAKEDIFSKIAYFEDGAYAELSIFTGSDSILCSVYLYKDEFDDYKECDEGFVGNIEFLLNSNIYNVCISSI